MHYELAFMVSERCNFIIRLNSSNPFTLQKIQLLKTVFDIGDANAVCDYLLLEIGDSYCCYALLKGEEKAFQKIKYITFDELEAEEALLQLLNELTKENCGQAIICPAFPQSFLSPNHGHKNDYILMDVIYDLPSQKFLKDEIPEWQMNVIYAVPISIFNLVKEKFRLAEFRHAYFPSIKASNGFTADQIDIHFTTKDFRVVVKKNKQVQLAQIYSYKTPLDVVYFLLKICYEFQVEQSEVSVILSGLVEENSAMYTELYSYFTNIHFAQAPTYSLPENEYPQHYFTSLYNLAACVS